jgi:hypothetical protein
MAKQGKKRVSITVNAERFDRVTSLIEKEGYPVGYLSYYLDRCISDLEDELLDLPHGIVPALEMVHYERMATRDKSKEK